LGLCEYVQYGAAAVGGAVSSGAAAVGGAVTSGAAAVGGAVASGAAAVGGTVTSAHERITSIEMPTLETNCAEARDDEELARTYLELPASMNSSDQSSRTNSLRAQLNDQASRHSSRKSVHSSAHESRHSSKQSVQSSNATSRYSPRDQESLHSSRDQETHYSARDQETHYLRRDEETRCPSRDQESRYSAREQESRHSSREQASHYSSKAQVSKTNSQRNMDVFATRGKTTIDNASSSQSQATYAWENLDDESLVLRPKIYPKQMQVGRELIDYDNLTVAYNEAAMVSGDLDDPRCSSDLMGRCFQWDEEGDDYTMNDGGDEYTLMTFQSGGSRTYQSVATKSTATHSIGRHYLNDAPSIIPEGDEERTYDSFDERVRHFE
jgi:hypothetical protein